MKKLIQSVLILVVMAIFCVGSTLAQTASITGTITDKKNSEPLVGVNVFIKSINKGSATDPDGKFSISSVPYGEYDVRISYLGYKTKTISVNVDQPEVSLNAALVMAVSQFEDVVVTAYGVEKQVNELSYSAQEVSSEKVSNTGSGNYLSGLSGRVSGLQVKQASGIGASNNIVLRGYNSLTGDNQALIVVDGVPYSNNEPQIATTSDEGSFDLGNSGVDLNSENIASLTVLKGPSAAALYGSRASNGAILIETKKGGPKRENIDVTIKSSTGVSYLNDNTIPKYQHQYGAGYTNSFQNLPNPFPNVSGSTIEAARTQADASWGPKFDPNVKVYQWDAFYKDSPTYGQKTAWTDTEHGPRYFFKTGVNVENSVNVSGNLQDSGYFTFGFNQKSQTGILPNSKVEDYKLNFKGGYDVTEDLTFSASANFSQTMGRARPGRGYNSYMTVIRQFGQTNVDYKKQKEAYFRSGKNQSWNLGSDLNSILYDNNPYWDRYENYQTDDRKHLTGYGKVKYDVLEWLSLTARVAIDNTNQFVEKRVNKGSATLSKYTRRRAQLTEYNTDLLVNYNKQLTEKLAIDGVVGANFRRDNNTGIYANTNGGLRVPRLYALSNSANPITFPEETDSRLGVNGYFASLNVNYNDYLTVALTGRRDKSSTLPEDNNVYYYPSASVGFTFSEFLDADWLSLGKVRGSWSQVGKTAPVFSLMDTYNRSSNFGSAPLYSIPDRRNNSDLKPEKTKAWETGLQLGFFNNRVTLDGTYYHQSSTNQIIPVPITPSSGYNSKFINSGEIVNKGVELQLQARPVISESFSWNLAVNWSKNENKIVSLAPGIDYYQFAGLQGGGNIGAKQGGAFGTIRGSDFIYKNGQRVVGSDGNYKVSSSTNNVIGNQTPDWTGGISNEFSYNNFSLSFLVDVRAGGDIYTVDQFYGQNTGTLPITVGLNKRGNPKRDPVSSGGGILKDGVNEDGSPNSNWAAVNFSSGYGYQSNPMAEYVYDGTYVKLRQATFSYNLPQGLIERLGVFDSATASVVGRNLWIIHKNLPYSDPEQQTGGNRLVGYQNSVFPATRNITFNLKLNF